MPYFYLVVIFILLFLFAWQLWQTEKAKDKTAEIEEQLFHEQTKNIRSEAEARAKDQTIDQHRVTIAELVAKLRKS